MRTIQNEVKHLTKFRLLLDFSMLLTVLFPCLVYSMPPIVRTEATMPGVLDPSIEQCYTGIHQPQMGGTGTVGGTDADYYQEEPPLLEGKISKPASHPY